jgi:FMN phosphatase YigB (HAD superfamily)
MRILDAYDAFIFDWDGTLVTSTPLVALDQIRKREGRLRLARRLKPVKPSARSLRSMAVATETGRLYSALGDLYCALFKPVLKEGSDTALAFLKSRGKRVAIFSDSRYYRLFREVRQLRIAARTDFVLSAQSIGYYKPDPTGLFAVARRFRVPARRCLYVCDMASDVITARLAGMDACAIADGIDSAGALEKERPRYAFRDMRSFAEALSRI